MAIEGPYLRGSHAVITGAGSGIGEAIASELARLGASLTLLGRRVERLERTASPLVGRFGVRVETIECDVTDERSVESAFAAARKVFGPPHVLVNNAGQAESAPFSDTSRELWDRMIAVNLTAHYLCIREVLPGMIEARAGRIVGIASTAGLQGQSRLAAYCVSKHGVIGLTRSLAAETVKLGITVNAVCPGYTDTDMTQTGVTSLMRAKGKTEVEARDMIVRTIPRGRLIEPAEVANAVGWLCGPGASAITGQAIIVAAGEVM